MSFGPLSPTGARSPACSTPRWDTIAMIRDNGNRVTFNYYSEYHTDDPLRGADEQRLLDEALRVGDAYPDTVLSHPYYLRALLSGGTEFGRFGYNVCPSMSWDHPAHATRRANGNPTLPLFNVYAPDLTLNNGSVGLPLARRVA